MIFGDQPKLGMRRSILKIRQVLLSCPFLSLVSPCCPQRWSQECSRVSDKPFDKCRFHETTNVRHWPRRSSRQRCLHASCLGEHCHIDRRRSVLPRWFVEQASVASAMATLDESIVLLFLSVKINEIFLPGPRVLIDMSRSPTKDWSSGLRRSLSSSGGLFPRDRCFNRRWMNVFFVSTLP